MDIQIPKSKYQIPIQTRVFRYFIGIWNLFFGTYSSSQFIRNLELKPLNFFRKNLVL